MALEMNSFADTMLRQRVVAQIEAAREGLELDPGANSSEEMENVLYQNAKTREEYMQLIASLVLHLNEKKRAALKNTGSAPQVSPSNGEEASNGQEEGAAKR